MRNKKPAYRPAPSAAPAPLPRAAGRQANSVAAPAFGAQQPAFIGALREGQEQYEASWRDRQAQFETAWGEREAQYATAWNERRTRFEAAWKEQQAQVEAALSQQQTLFEALWSGKQTLYQSAWDEQQLKFDAAWKERHAYFETVWKEQQAQYESSWKERQAQIEAALKLVTAPAKPVGPETSRARPQPEPRPKQQQRQATGASVQQSSKGAAAQGLGQLQKHSALLQAKFAEPLEKYTGLKGSQDFATAATQEHNNVQSMFADLALQNSEGSKQALGRLSHYSKGLKRSSAPLPDREDARTKSITSAPATSIAMPEPATVPDMLGAAPATNAAEADELKAQISLRLEAISKSKDGMATLESALLKSLAKEQRQRGGPGPDPA
ncbi:hypothetical protein IWW47_000275 [Coemansia sp. RSA 2052]|nr:hypothetical protein IWW47_000275 [Coemansia sp. RSA 2052]